MQSLFCLRPEERDTSLDRVQEHIEDGYLEDADPLPSDKEERALALADRHSVVTLAEAYRDYLERGGMRS